MAEKKQYISKKKQEQLSEQYGKMPPSVIEFEESVLGALMLEKDAIYDIIDILKPEYFYSTAHGCIYKAILDLSANHNPIDIKTVSQQLKINGDFDKIEGPFYLAQLTDKVGSTAHLDYHARIIAQKFIQRELIRVGADIQEQAFEETDDISDMLDKAEQSLFDIAEGNIKKEVSRVDAVVREALKRIEEAAKRPDGLVGVPSGFTDLDRKTNGWQAPDLVIIAARPAMGKTAFVLSMARNAAVDHNAGVVIFSLEMDAVQLVNRLMSAESEIYASKLKTGKLKNWEWEQLESKIKRLEDAPLFIDDTPALSVFEFRAKMRRLKMQHDIKLVIIDYLQLMSAGVNIGSREQEVSSISRSLKAIAKELNVPVIALSQLNRSVEVRGGDKRPQLSDLRESGAIEQDADMVMFIHRPEYYGQDKDGEGNSLKGLAEIIVAKHRNGSVGSVLLKFQSDFIKFTDKDSDFGQPKTIGSKLNNKEQQTEEDKEGEVTTASSVQAAGYQPPQTPDFNQVPPDINQAPPEDDGLKERSDFNAF